MYCSFVSIGCAEMMCSAVSSDYLQSLHFLCLSTYYHYYIIINIIIIIISDSRNALKTKRIAE